MKKVQHLFVLFCALSSASLAQAHTLIQEILEQKAPQGGRPHMVIDIDDTLCVSFKPRKLYINQKNIYERYPGSLLVPYVYTVHSKMTQSTKLFVHDHIFFPDVMETILTALHFGWVVDIFSAGLKERNETLMKCYLTYMLGYYTETPEDDLTLLLQERIHMFSRTEAIAVRKNLNGEFYRVYVKKLTNIGLSLDNSMLIDDKRYSVDDDEYPFIDATLPLSQKCYGENAKTFNPLLHIKELAIFKDGEMSQEHRGFFQESADGPAYPYGDLAAYYTGVMALAYHIMETQGVLLREAVSQVLLRKDFDASAPLKLHETQWYLQKSCLHQVPHDTYCSWLSKGRAHISAIKERRLASYTPPQDPYMDMARKQFQSVFASYLTT